MKIRYYNKNKSQKRLELEVKIYKTISIICLFVMLATVLIYNYNELMNEIEDLGLVAEVKAQEIQYVNYEPETPENAILSLSSEVSEPLSVEEQIRQIAEEENFKWIQYLVDLARCESRFDPNAVNTQGNNPSWSVDRGLFQFNSYWHPEITDECAYSVDCSTKKTMELINAGLQSHWVCDRLIR